MVNERKKLLMLQLRLSLKNVEFSLKLSKIIIFTLGLCKLKILSESKNKELMNYSEHLLNKKHYAIDIFPLLVSK